jgi:hypothetical protein
MHGPTVLPAAKKAEGVPTSFAAVAITCDPHRHADPPGRSEAGFLWCHKFVTMRSSSARRGSSRHHRRCSWWRLGVAGQSGSAPGWRVPTTRRHQAPACPLCRDHPSLSAGVPAAVSLVPCRAAADRRHSRSWQAHCEQPRADCEAQRGATVHQLPSSAQPRWLDCQTAAHLLLGFLVAALAPAGDG